MEIKQAGQYELVEVLYLLKVYISELTSKGCLPWEVPKAQTIEDIDKKNVFIAKFKNISIGLLILDPKKTALTKATGNTEKNNKNVLYISRLALHPKWFNQETGNELLLFVEKYATDHQFESIRFEVYAGNIQVIDLFHSFQFKKAGEVHLPFHDIPIVCLEKKIN
jgi:N-acetylglutamate synthase-like GNAT family acetyltransferase